MTVGRHFTDFFGHNWLATIGIILVVFELAS
jgi:hypothetical protein